MAQVDALARERKCTAVRFDAAYNHAGLLAFYENLGYANLGKVPTSWGAVICFEKILPDE